MGAPFLLLSIILVSILSCCHAHLNDDILMEQSMAHDAVCFASQSVPFRIGPPRQCSALLSKFATAMAMIRPKGHLTYNRPSPKHGVNLTCGDILRRHQQYFPSELITPDMWPRVLAIADVISAKMTRSMVLEIRMNLSNDTDPSFQLQRSMGGDELLRVYGPKPPRNSRAGRVWRRIHDFAVNWSNRKGPIHGLVYDMWFELDVAHALKHSSVPVPSMFIGTDDGLRGGLHSAGMQAFAKWAGVPLKQVFWDIEGFLATAPPPLSAPFPPSVLRNIVNAVFALPYGMNVYQVGLWFARETSDVPSGVRLVLEVEEGTGVAQGIDWTDIVVDYLASIGWNGDGDALKKYMKQAEEIVEYQYIAVDIGDEIGDRIGLETYADDSAWPSIIKKLFKQGLATVEKTEALLSFMKGAKGPKRYTNVTIDGNEYVLSRRLNHIKIMFENNMVIGYKVYFYSGFFIPSEMRGKQGFLATTEEDSGSSSDYSSDDVDIF